MKKKVLIPWSGGLDSTFLVIYYAELGYNVHTVYFEIENNKNKVEMELVARQNILNVLHKRYNNIKDYGTTFKLDVSHSNNILNFSQMPIWMTGILLFANSYDEIAIGYTMNDDAASYVAEFKQIFNNYKKIKNWNSKWPKITFPVLKYKKDYTVQLIQSKGLSEVLNQLWWCEDPINKTPCHNCAACKRYERELTGYLPQLSIKELDASYIYKKDTDPNLEHKCEDIYACS